MGGDKLHNLFYPKASLNIVYIVFSHTAADWYYHSIMVSKKLFYILCINICNEFNMKLYTSLNLNKKINISTQAFS